jgi:hypothetical protein
MRTRLCVHLAEARQICAQAPGISKVVPMRVSLVKKALAKSHRPTGLFGTRTCPIIGAGKPAELYVKGTESGIRALQSQIERSSSQGAIKEISAVKDIRAVEPADRLQGRRAEHVFSAAPQHERKAVVKVSLFDYRNATDEEAKIAAFELVLTERGLQFTRHETFRSQEVYSVECTSAEDVEFLSRTVMVRSIGPMPVFRSLRGNSLSHRPIPADLASPGPDPDAYPIVAVVDSGVSDPVAPLREWVHARERHVSPAEENTYHGTFVAGLIVWGNQLNATHGEIGNHPCRLLDVHVLPNSDASVGPVGTVSEPEFLQDLEDCLARHANEVKVWNLSLGTDEVCRLDGFSDFAVQLDNLQEQYGVTFVIAAGNYDATPLLGFPRTDDEKDRGRITAPADSVLGISIGSIGHVDHPSVNGIRRGEPSAFSRNGPGPNYVIKPDLVHFGGTIARDASSPLGMTSVVSPTSIGEDLGTSFAAPLVARQLAHIHHAITPAPSATVARAVLVHCARDIRTGARVEDGNDHFLGFGTPLNIDQALECNPWTMTLVFEEALRPGYFLEWDHFPYPQSLVKDGHFFGEIWMTLAYPPLRDPDWGSEYCETHIDASFGLYRNQKGTEKYASQVPLEHNNAGILYESFQVQNLRKWSPVRTYHRRIVQGVSGLRWRLFVRLLSRHDVDQGALSSQPFALLLTISDPDHTAPVYDEMVQVLRTRFQTQNLIVRPRVRIEAQS